MSRKTLMIALAMLALLAPIAAAQTVDEVLAKSFEARGGVKKLKAVQSVRTTGRMVMPQGFEIPFTRVQQRPNRFRMELSVQGMTGVQAYDGTTAWSVMPMMGKPDPAAMAPEEAQRMEEQSDMDGPLMDYKAKGNTVELVGKEPVEGADAWKLKLTLKNGEIQYLYLDAETYLEIKSEGKAKVMGNEVDNESFIRDYREVSGIMTPFAIESGEKGSSQRRKLLIDKVEMNVALPANLFGMPGPATTAPAKAAAPDTSKAAAPDTSKAAAPDTSKAAPPKH